MDRYWNTMRRWIGLLLVIITVTACAGTQSPPAATKPAATPTTGTEPTATPTAQTEPTATAGIPGELAGPTWRLLFFGPADRLSALPPYARLIAEFGEDGRLTGLGGCNWYTAAVSIEGTSMSVSDLDQTNMTGCPPEALQQERDYLALLQRATEYTIKADQLQISTGDGQLIFEAQPNPPIWVEIADPQEGAVLDLTQPVAIEGRGQGMFEGNVVIRILDAESNVLAEQAVIMKGENVGTGAEGTWQVSLSPQGKAGAPARIAALSHSPADGSVVAIDVVEVTFGQ